MGNYMSKHFTEDKIQLVNNMGGQTGCWKRKEVYCYSGCGKCVHFLILEEELILVKALGVV